MTGQHGLEQAMANLDRYAGLRLILSWRQIPGRGLVVVAADMQEHELRTAREAALFTGGLASADQAIRLGYAGGQAGDGGGAR